MGSLLLSRCALSLCVNTFSGFFVLVLVLCVDGLCGDLSSSGGDYLVCVISVNLWVGFFFVEFFVSMSVSEIDLWEGSVVTIR